jgi:RNA polymerase sigma-70 factor (ECF subfamily)
MLVPLTDAPGIITTDVDLVQAARGDPQAFEPLYRRYADRIYAFLVRRTGNPADAEDLTSLTFAGPWRSWTVSVATRSQAGCSPLPAMRPLIARRRPRLVPLGALAEEACDPQAEPLDLIIANERISIVRVLVAQLPGTQREILQLRVVGQLSNAEIAMALGKSEDAVKMHIHRIIVRLRREFQAAIGETQPETS